MTSVGQVSLDKSSNFQLSNEDIVNILPPTHTSSSPAAPGVS